MFSFLMVLIKQQSFFIILPLLNLVKLLKPLKQCPQCRHKALLWISKQVWNKYGTTKLFWVNFRTLQSLHIRKCSIDIGSSVCFAR